MRYAAIAATGFAEGASNDTKATATAVSLPAVIQGASLTDDADTDWFKITIAAGDVGKKFSVATYAGAPRTDTLITIYDPSNAEFAVSEDETTYHETLLSDPITVAGTYYVVISASAFGLGSDQDYDAANYQK